MWISRAKYEQMTDRLCNLHDEVKALRKDLEYKTRIWAEQPGSGIYVSPLEVGVKEAIYSIIDHLGVRFERIRGIPERDVLVKVKKG